MRSAALAALAAMREETPGLEELLGCVEVLDQSVFTSSPLAFIYRHSSLLGDGVRREGEPVGR